jgi:hypothetical protein
VIAIKGRDFVEHEEEEAGFVSVIMRELSRFSGTEQISTGHHLDFALEGAALVIVHCPCSESKKKAWSLMEPWPLITRTGWASIILPVVL